MAMIWAGIDEGKTHHHCVAIDESGRRLLSRRVANHEPELLTDVLALGDEVTWGIDLADGGAALAITILSDHEQSVHYISGRAIHRASESYRGEGKTDAKDAAVIADQVRIRRDLHPLRIDDETVTDLRILTGRRMDLVADRTRTVNRLRAQLSGIFPGLERALDLTNTGPLMLLTGYQTPAAIRGRRARQGDRGPVSRASGLRVITSMPGLGVILGAEFLAATGGDMSLFGTPDRLAGFGGVAPVPRDSGKISGNLRRPRRYNRRLQRVFYISALFSIRHCDESRRSYERKRAEGKRHIQAVLARARRRVNVLWALLRDGRTYELVPPIALAA